jgi:hypothetical protein
MRSFSIPQTAARCVALVAAVMTGLLLLPTARAAESPTYKAEWIAKLGDRAGDFVLEEKGGYIIGGILNDRGQAAFLYGGRSQAGIFQYSDGKLTPVAVSGHPTPDGKLYAGNFGVPIQMNQRGSIVFDAGVSSGDTYNYLWDYAAQQTMLLRGKGMPGPNGVEFTGGDGWHAVINNHDEIALAAVVRNPPGPSRAGVFFRQPDGNLRTIALPGQVLPDGSTVGDAAAYSINDAGMVTFVTAPPGETVLGSHSFVHTSAYLWENGAITPVAVVGQKVADGGDAIATVTGAWLNEQNRSVLVAASLQSHRAWSNLFRFAAGKLTPVVLYGQDMPGVGRVQLLLGDDLALRLVSNGNASGQHAFVGGSNADRLYLLEADGSLSLVLKDHTVTDLGNTIMLVNCIGLNNKGQILIGAGVGSTVGLGVLTPMGDGGAVGG